MVENPENTETAKELNDKADAMKATRSTTVNNRRKTAAALACAAAVAAVCAAAAYGTSRSTHPLRGSGSGSAYAWPTSYAAAGSTGSAEIIEDDDTAVDIASSGVGRSDSPEGGVTPASTTESSGSVKHGSDSKASHDASATASAAEAESPNAHGAPSSQQSSSTSSAGAGSGKTHTHNWVQVTTTVHHDAQYQTVHHDAQYQTVHHDAQYNHVVVCRGCGAQFNSYDAWCSHSDSQLLNGVDGCGRFYTTDILIKQAYDEQVQTQAAYDEQVLVRAAYDETVTTGCRCSVCGATK